MMTLPLPSNEIPAIAELAQRRQWVCWRVDTREGKPTKIPVQPNGMLAATDNPRTWSTFAEVCEAAKRQGWGIGYVFNGDVVGVDLDKCRDPATGRIEPWALEICNRLRSYTEVSPSGTGLHILCRGPLPRDGGRRGQIEVYTRRRFFCVTGVLVEQWPDEIVECEDALEWLWATHIRRSAPEAPPNPVEEIELPWDKFEAIMENDSKFRKTWLHKRPDLEDQSFSAFDFSLCVMAAQTGWSDPELAALISHHRRKWGSDKDACRKDYVARTIANTRDVMRRRIEGNESLASATAQVYARERATEALDGGQDAALAELRQRLGLPIERVVITGAKTAIAYALVLDDGRRIDLGKPGAVLEQSTMRRAAFAAVGKVLPTVKQPLWDATVMVLQASAEREEAADSDPAQELTEIVEQYAFHTTVMPWESEHAGGAFRNGMPLRRDGRLMLTINHFQRWCHHVKGHLTSLKTEDFRSRFRLAGWSGEKITRRVEGAAVCRFYWFDANSVTEEGITL